MDTVRFGRALGRGARHATKALIDAADAAASPNPSPTPSQRPQTARAAPPHQPNSGIGQKAAQTTAHVRQTSQGIARGSKRFGEAVWGPFVRLSGVLWLEVTGVFFGLFALTAATNAWNLRSNWHDIGTNHTEHQHLLLALGVAILFGYFTISSFLQARRRERRR